MGAAAVRSMNETVERLVLRWQQDGPLFGARTGCTIITINEKDRTRKSNAHILNKLKETYRRVGVHYASEIQANRRKRRITFAGILIKRRNTSRGRETRSTLDNSNTEH